MKEKKQWERGLSGVPEKEYKVEKVPKKKDGRSISRR